MPGPGAPYTSLDANQVLRQSFDETTDTLRTTAVATIVTPPALEVAIDASDDSIRLGDGTKLNTITTIGSKNAIDVNIAGGSISVTIGALLGPLETMVVPISDTPTQLNFSLSGTRSVSMRVWNGSTVYLSESGAIGTNGYPKKNQEEFIVDAAADGATFVMYACCDTGQTSELRIMMISS